MLVDELGISLPELALRFVISSPNVSTVLTGSRSLCELQENIDSVERGPLPKDVLARLDEIAGLVPFRPCEEPFFLPFDRDYRGPGPAGR